MSRHLFVRFCLVPLGIVVLAFFVLPLVRLLQVGASGADGIAAYWAILTTPRYRESLVATLALAIATTLRVEHVWQSKQGDAGAKATPSCGESLRLHQLL